MGRPATAHSSLASRVFVGTLQYSVSSSRLNTYSNIPCRTARTEVVDKRCLGALTRRSRQPAIFRCVGGFSRLYAFL